MTSFIEQNLEWALAKIDALRRPASVAKIGGFKPLEQVPTSYFGGNFVGLSNEEWPQYRNRKMLPLMQVRTDELLYLPDELSNIALFTVFIDSELPPAEASNGNGWLIRKYSSLVGLRPYSNPLVSSIKTFPIRWLQEDSDIPAWEDIWEIVREVDPKKIESLLDLYHSRYRTQAGTKVGGWPSYVQGAIDEEGKFVFQINSEPKAEWQWADNGTGYFYVDKTHNWKLYWQCY